MEQIFQRAESEAPPGILVQVLRNTRSAEFAAELYVVLIDLPREAIDDLVIGVDAMPGIARGSADLREERSAAGWRGGQQDNR